MTSLLLPHTDVSMRPDDKDMTEVFDLDDLFDQYVETDLPRFSDITAEPSGCDDLAHLFELPSSNDSDPIETATIPNWDASEDAAWHKALRALGQNPASPSTSDNSFSIYPESRGRASQSDPTLFNLDEIFELERTTESEPRLTHSTPSTPKPEVARQRQASKVASSNPDRSIRSGIQKSTKKISNLAKMMRPSHFRANIQDLWTRKVEGSTTDPYSVSIQPIGMPLSPSSKYAQSESTNNNTTTNTNTNHFIPRAQPYTLTMSPTTGASELADLHQSNYQLTPLTSPALDFNSRHNNSNDTDTETDAGNPFQFSNDNMATAYISHLTSQTHAALSALQTPPPSTRLPLTTWTTETPASLDFGSFDASPDFQSLSTPQLQHAQNAGTNNSGSVKQSDWWSNGAAAAAVTTAAQPSTPTFQSTTSQSRSSSHNAGLGFVATTLSGGGLGISCDSAPFSGFGSEISSSLSNTSTHAMNHSHSNPNLSAGVNYGVGASVSASASPSFEMSYAQHLQHAHMYAPSTPGIPIGRPNARTPSRTPSPTPQMRFSRRRHSAHHSHSLSHSHAHTQSHTHPHHQSPNHRRRKSSSNSATQHSGQRSSSANVGFVNFTPHDSRKILTGVAPSGSSKTKARREKEAAEKRRKLSQAAMKAVIEAGGDIRGLEEGGLLSLGVE